MELKWRLRSRMVAWLDLIYTIIILVVSLAFLVIFVEVEYNKLQQIFVSSFHVHVTLVWGQLFWSVFQLLFFLVKLYLSVLLLEITRMDRELNLEKAKHVAKYWRYMTAIFITLIVFDILVDRSELEIPAVYFLAILVYSFFFWVVGEYRKELRYYSEAESIVAVETMV